MIPDTDRHGFGENLEQTASRDMRSNLISIKKEERNLEFFSAHWDPLIPASDDMPGMVRKMDSRSGMK